jgi:hypothetical protein
MPEVRVKDAGCDRDPDRGAHEAELGYCADCYSCGGRCVRV